MTRHTEDYRYEIQHGDDADIVAYQRKSSDGVWRSGFRVDDSTTGGRPLSAGQPLIRPSAESACERASNIRLRVRLTTTNRIVLGAMFYLHRGCIGAFRAT